MEPGPVAQCCQLAQPTLVSGKGNFVLGFRWVHVRGGRCPGGGVVHLSLDSELNLGSGLWAHPSILDRLPCEVPATGTYSVLTQGDPGASLTTSLHFLPPNLIF